MRSEGPGLIPGLAEGSDFDVENESRNSHRLPVSR